MTREQARLALRRAERHLKARDEALAAVIRRAGPCGLEPHRQYFKELVQSIVGQQLSGKAAATIYGRLIQLFPGRRAPRPDELLAVPDAQLRSAGLSRAKTAALKDLSARVHDGRLALHRVSRLDDDELRDALVAVRGIGEWTAHMFMMFSLCRLDVLPTGDLGVRKGIQQLYGLTSLPTPDEMRALAVAKGWAPYRSVASWYMWRVVDDPTGRVRDV